MPCRFRFFPFVLFGIISMSLCSNLVPLAHAQKKPVAPTVPAGYPALTSPMNLGGVPGATVELSLVGTQLGDVTGVWTSFGGTATIAKDQKDAKSLRFSLKIPDDTKPGMHSLRVSTTKGISNLRTFCIDHLPPIEKNGKNGTKETAQTIPSACVVTGQIRTEASDFYKIPVQAGKAVTVEALGRRLGSPIDPVIFVYDGSGKELAGVYADDTPGLQSDARVTLTPKTSGELIVEIRDTIFRGGADYVYRLRVGEFVGATTAYPLYVQRGQSAKIGFTGESVANAASVSLTASKDPSQLVAYVAPGKDAWPVPVLLTDRPETQEKEPNNTPAQANPISVPIGISARFLEKNDVDHFRFPAKKGGKFDIVAETYRLNSPTEVYLRVLDAKGAELAKSNPQQPAAKIAFTAPADGEYVVACEHLNYLSGPHEVYHLRVTLTEPDFAVTVGLDRIDVPIGGIGLLPITGITKANGFAAPIELKIESDELQGALTLPAGANPTATAPIWLPLKWKAGAKAVMGPEMLRLIAVAKVGGKELVRVGSVDAVVKAEMADLPNPPDELAGTIAVAITPTPRFQLAVKFDSPTVEQGKTLKGTITATRAKGFDDAITISEVDLPPNITIKLNPIAKGKIEATFELLTTPKTAAQASEIILKGTAAGEHANVAPIPFTVTATKKPEPKKPEPKKK